METFDGTMTLDDGEQVAVELALDTESLTLRTGGNLIGAWPVKYCRVSRSGRGAFLLSIDGEKVVFEPTHLESFAKTAAHRFRASTLADRIGVVRDLPNPDAPEGTRSRSRSERRTDADPPPRARLRLTLPSWLVPAVTAVAVVLVVGALISRAGDDVPDFVATSIPTVSTLVVPPSALDLSLADFTVEWNLAATTFGVPSQIRGVLVPEQFESQLSSFMTLQGRTDPDGTIGSLVLVVDPTGATEDDQQALRTLNLVVRVASPELDGEGRAEVFEQLGLDVRNPVLTGVEGATEVGGVAYTLSWIPEFGSLLFTVNDA